MLQRRSIQVTPLRTPTNRSGYGSRKEIDRHNLDLDDSGNSALRRPISLVAARDDSEGGDLGNIDIKGMEMKLLKA